MPHIRLLLLAVIACAVGLCARAAEEELPTVPVGLDTGLQALLENKWQGNVRELNHVVERAVLMAQDNLIRLQDLALRTGREAPARLEDMSLEDVEAFLIKKALARYDGNVSHAANALGLSRSALYRRLQRYGLST